ncbi:MAG: SDR family NAD(P)-dependent oxidoreductase [Pseudomonadota bacterium]
MFAGQGSQWWGMARDLLREDPDFQAAVNAYDADFRIAAGWSIKEELLRDEAETRIDDTTVTQPALFAIQAGLAAVWAKRGVLPDMVVGHSIGEAAAAYVAGGLTQRGAAQFLSKRGAIRDRLDDKGAMAAVGMPAADVAATLPEHGLVEIAAINGPGLVTVSGDYDKIHEYVEEFSLAHPNTFIRILKVDTAWHSYQLDAGEAWFRDEVTSLDWSAMRLPFISTVTGKTETRFDVDYAWSNLRQPVRFQAGVETALNMGASVFLELGPHTTLSGPASSTAAEMGRQATILNSLNRKRNDFDAITDASAQLYVAGIDLDWEALNGAPAEHIDLPRYPWDNEPLWVEPDEWRADVQMSNRHPFLGMNVEGAGRSWMTEVNLRAFPYLADHRLQSECVFPGAAYMEIMLSATRRHLGEGVIEITEMKIHEALFIPLDGDVRIWTMYNPMRGLIQIYSNQRGGNEDWVLRAEGFVRINSVEPAPVPTVKELTEGLNSYTTEKLYSATVDDGVINYGNSFRTVEKFWASGNRSAALIRLAPDAEPGFEDYLAHPTTLDGCLQVSDPRIQEAAYIIDENEFEKGEVTETYMPIGARRVRLFAPVPRECYAICTYLEWPDAHTALNDCTVVDAEGNVVLEMTGLMARQLESTAARQHPEGFAPHFAVETFDRYRPAQEAEAPKPDQRWLVIGKEGAAANAVADGLAARGAAVVRQPLEPMTHEDMTGTFADLLEALILGEGLDGIAYAGALDAPEIDEDTDAATVEAFVTEQCSALISLGAAFDEVRDQTVLPRLALLTKAGRPAPEDAGMTVNGALQAPLTGLFRTLTNETPEIDAYQYDVDAATLAAPDRLIDLLLTPGEEFEVVLRETGDLVPRLKRVWEEELPAMAKKVPAEDAEVNFEVTMETPGVIDNLEMVEIPLAPLGPDEVRVKVAAVGLNFRDIMAVTALLPREAETEPAWRNLGLEFSGEVVAVGENCSQLKPGDRVMGLAKRCLQRFLAVPEAAVVVVPEHISMEEAATIPSAFATAYYALVEIGRLKASDKALIHVATGGVGQAALQIAQGIGAEIFATAGSPEKRALLREKGVEHVMNSRDLAFADEVMRVTEGRGVDVVLNSLPGAYIEKGIDILAPYGRFLEIGKRDVYEDSAIGLKALRKNISLSVLDLAAMGAERPDLLSGLFTDLVTQFRAKELSPLPFTAFPVSETAGAFRYMSQAKHIGKVVVTFDEAVVAVKADRARAVTMAADGTYLITGGNGGFGLSVADWMSQVGAGRLCLASRSGKVGEEDEARVEAIRARGTEVDLISLDVADTSAVEALIQTLATDGTRPLKGVLHAAALIKDGFIMQLTAEMIADVLRPKVVGMWNLHQALRRQGSDAFLVSFSSVAALIGSAGQANYVAANAFLDAMSVVRAQAGDPAGSVQWGAIAAKGMVARNEALQNYLESIGLKGLEEEETPAAIEALFRTSAPTIFYANADWQQMARANPKLGATPRVSGMLAKAGTETSDVRARLMTLEGDDLINELVDFVRGELNGVLNVDIAQIDAERPIAELGLDSLSSFELKMRMETALGLSLQVAKFLQAPTTIGLARLAAEELEAAKAEASSETGKGDAAGAERQTASETGPVLSLSDRGAGLLRETVAQHSSASTISAFECRRQFWCSTEHSLAALKKAAGRVTRRHPLLAAQPSGFDAGAALSFDGPGLAVVTAAQIDETTATALDVAGGELARLTVAPSPDGGSDWLLQVHRAIGDETSATLIASDLAHLLAEAPLPRAVPKRKLFDLLTSCVYDPEALSCENDRAFWYYSMGQTARTVEITDRGKALPTTLGRDHGAAEEYSATLATHLTEPQAAAAFGEALRAATSHEDAILLSRRVSLRHRLPQGPALGPFETDQPLLVEGAMEGGSDHGWLERTLGAATDHDRFDMAAARSTFASEFQETGLCPVQFGFAYGPAEQLELAIGDLQLVERPLTRAAIAYDVELVVTPSPDATAITLRTDASVVSHALVARLIGALEAHLGCAFDATELKLPVEAAQ